MRLALVSLWFLAALASGCATAPASAAQPPREPMVPLTGEPPVFAESGRKSFPSPRARCFEAIQATFKNSGHGVDQADLAAGVVVSGKTTTFRGTQTHRNGTTSELVVDDKFYTRVSGDDASCAVAVTRLRVWTGTVEVETRTQSWVEAQLRGFMRGVEAELASARP